MSDAVAVPHVFTAINEVAKVLSQSGIAKSEKNRDQNFMFRGIDQVLNELAKPLHENRLRILPKDIEREVASRPTKSGGVMWNVVVKVIYEIVDASDGSSTSVVSYGEASDSADKATGKALSMAFKSLVFVTFCVPTEPEVDADADHHDPQTGQKPIVQPTAKAPPAETETAAAEPAPSTQPPASAALVKMLQKAMAAKGDAGAALVKERLKASGAAKVSEMPKDLAVTLLHDLVALA